MLIISDQEFIKIDNWHYENTFKRFCPSNEGIRQRDSLFNTMWELFVWAAILGYLNKQSDEIKTLCKNSPFRWAVMKDPHDKMLLIMAIEDMGTFEKIKNPEEIAKNIECHANGGLNLIHKEKALDAIAYTSIDSMITMIQNRLSQKSGK